MNAPITRETRTVVKGLSALARRVGVSQGHLSLVLHGLRKPGADLEKKLRKLGVEITAAQ